MEFETVGDLLEALEGIDPETPLKVAYQPGWPLMGRIANVRGPVDVTDTSPVWIAISEGDGYAPKYAWREA